MNNVCNHRWSAVEDVLFENDQPVGRRVYYLCDRCGADRHVDPRVNKKHPPASTIQIDLYGPIAYDEPPCWPIP